MNKFHLYMIWELQSEPDRERGSLEMRNYSLVEVTHDRDYAQSRCESEDGKFVYSFIEAWHGQNG